MDPCVSYCAALFLGRGVASTVLEQTPMPEVVWSFRLRGQFIWMNQHLLRVCLCNCWTASKQNFNWVRRRQRLCAISFPGLMQNLNLPLALISLQWNNTPSLPITPLGFHSLCSMEHTQDCAYMWAAVCLVSKLSWGQVPVLTVAFLLDWNKGLLLPQGMRAHSTRSMVASWALFKGVSVTAICAVTSW